MADIELTSESTPATPASGATTIFVTKPMPGPPTIQLPYGLTSGVGGIQGHMGAIGLITGSVSGGMIHTGGQRELAFKDDGGKTHLVRKITNTNFAADSPPTTEFYLTGSSILVPQHGLKIGTIFRWRFTFTKSTAGGVATMIWAIKSGTAHTASDAAICSFTFGAQSAVTDTGCCEIVGVVRAVGTTGVIAGGCILTHILAATGINSQQTQISQATSASTDFTATPQYIGVSVNAGASSGLSFNTQGAEYVEAVNL